MAIDEPFDKATTKVGFVGLGNMGGPMARNLVTAGWNVAVADLDPAKVDAVVAVGASASPSAVDLAAECDVVLTSLPGPRQVRAVGEDILAAMSAGATWIDLSTNDLDCSRDMQARAAQASVLLLDAPVTGGAEGAEAATLTVLVGGPESVFDRSLPVLSSIGSRVELLGPSGAGYVAKIASVSLCYTQSICLTEALLLGARGGVVPERMLEVIQNSTGRSYVADLYGPEILNGGYDDTFALELAAKDLRLAMELGDTVGARLPFMSQVTEFYAETVEQYGADAPHLMAVKALEEANDLILHQAAEATEPTNED